MAEVSNYTTNVLLRSCAVKSLHGRIGDTVYIYRKGKQHARPYVVPSNPRTKAQRARRAVFAEAIHAWKILSTQEKDQWYTRGRRMRRNGYNLFISLYMREAAQRILIAKVTRGTPFHVLRNWHEYHDRILLYTGTRYVRVIDAANRASPKSLAA